MNKIQIQKIIDALESEEEKFTISVLYNVYAKNLKALQIDYTKSKIQDYQASEEALNKHIEKITSIQKEKETLAEINDDFSFQNRPELLIYLQDQGYKIKKSKFYQDVNKGILRISADGKISEPDLKLYTSTLNRRDASDQKGIALLEKKTRKEIERLEAQVEKLKFELDRDQEKYVLKSDVETETAIKIAAFEAGLRHFAQTCAVNWINLVNGDPQLAQLLINGFNIGLDELLDEFASLDEIKIIIRKDDRDQGSGIGDQGSGKNLNLTLTPNP